jgi:hypothetical protein
LVWVSCCGVAGVGLAGFCGSDAEIVTLVIALGPVKSGREAVNRFCFHHMESIV